MSERIPGVIVTYFPDAEFEARLGAIAREVWPVLVVDNTASAAMSDRLVAICGRCGCRLLLNPSNLGIAAALNRGFGELEQLGCAWAVAFDQDSTPEPGLADRLAECARRLANGRPAVIGANWRDEGRPDHPSLHLQPHPSCHLLFRRVPADDDIGDVTCVIASGSLFHLPTWRALGGFDESLFLDLVDAEYCLRARHAGRAIGVAAHAHLRHNRGSKRPVRLLGITWWPAFMPPTRLFGLFRNRVLLIRRYLWQRPHWVAFELAYACKVLAEILFLEDHKGAKLGACLGGTWSGFWGQRGTAARPVSASVLPDGRQ
jgi:rhamnosyltransferase